MCQLFIARMNYWRKMSVLQKFMIFLLASPVELFIQEQCHMNNVKCINARNAPGCKLHLRQFDCKGIETISSKQPLYMGTHASPFLRHTPINDTGQFGCSIIDTVVSNIDATVYCSNINAAVLTPGYPHITHINLCNMWIRNSCYKNQLLINSKNCGCSVSLGPAALHFIKGDRTFSGFSLELLPAKLTLTRLTH